MKNVRYLFVIVMVLSATGCLSTRMAPLELDELAKEFAPPAHKSYIYVMRYDTAYGALASMKVLLEEHLETRV